MTLRHCAPRADVVAVRRGREIVTGRTHEGRQRQRIGESVAIIDGAHGQQVFTVDLVELDPYAQVVAAGNGAACAKTEMGATSVSVVICGLPSPRRISTRLAVVPASTKSSAPAARSDSKLAPARSAAAGPFVTEPHEAGEPAITLAEDVAAREHLRAYCVALEAA